MAMTRRRVRTHPLCPEESRIRLQSSIGTGAGGVGVGGGADSAPLAESCLQSCGSLGAGGIGGNGILLSLDDCFFERFLGDGGGTGGFGGGGAERGATRRPITSTFSPSFTCKKLGDCRSGSV